MTWRISTDGSTAVSTEVEYLPLSECPRNVSVWLLTRYGKPVDGIYTGQSDVVGWSPKPMIPKFMKELLK